MNVTRGWEHLIRQNKYVQSCQIRNIQETDLTSFSSLVDFPLKQSQCVRLGIALERVLCDFILEFNTLTNIKVQNKSGQQETDHLFCNNDTKTIYFAELKTNINLDTEKSRSTCQKCKDIVEELQRNYNNYTVHWGLVACRYLKQSDIPQTLRKKYKSIENNLLGINDYLKMLCIEKEFSSDEFKQFVNSIANESFRKNS